jgi:cytochrome P450
VASRHTGLPQINIAEVVSRVTAHDVVAITLRAVVYYLAKNPDIQKKLQKEIEDAVEAGQLSNPAKYTEITSMKYM